jgi:GNAT superfamily N-acetyltransferase
MLRTIARWRACKSEVEQVRPRAMNERADITWSPVVQTLPGGERVTIRVVRPQDADALQAYFRGLSAESRYRRFLGALAELTTRQLARLTEMDGPDELALLAFAQVRDALHLVGEAVLAGITGGARSEFALSVTDAWQRKGVGAALLADLECRARMRGARYLYGDVLRTNTPMKNLARKAGFALRSPFTDARLIEIGKDLSVTAPDLPCRERFARLMPKADPDAARSLPRPG